MTPHRHWFHTFVPWRVPVKIANGQIIYSEGKGTVLFIPEGSSNRPTVAITDVLFVPELGCNLLSPLHLTQHKGFSIAITKDLILFKRDTVTLLHVTVTDTNVGTLNGQVQVQVQQHAQSSQVVLDRSLLHRRLEHISQDRLESLLKNKLVVNLKLDSETPMSGLCDACILGKQHRSPFS